MSTLTQSPAWKALESHHKEASRLHMRDLFAKETQRFQKFSVRFDDIFLDFSKNRVTEETWRLLLDLARQADVPAWTRRMFAVEKINVTEGRAVLHVALRNRAN